MVRVGALLDVVRVVVCTVPRAVLLCTTDGAELRLAFDGDVVRAGCDVVAVAELVLTVVVLSGSGTGFIAESLPDTPHAVSVTIKQLKANTAAGRVILGSPPWSRASDLGARYWDRTSDLFGVNEALYP